MPNEIERAFAALTEEAARARPADASSVRRRADRRGRTRAVAAVAAAVVLISGLTVGSRVVLAGPGPLPAASVPPSPTISRKTPPKEIPDRAFLQPADVPGRLNGEPLTVASDDQALVQFCDEVYDRPNKVAVRAARQYPIHPAGDPRAVRTFVQEDVIVYRGTGAEDFMYHLTEAVKYCTTTEDDAGVAVTFTGHGSIGAGDDSLLIERTRAEVGIGGKATGAGDASPLFWVAVRVGDSIAFVSNLGWEANPADRAETIELGRRAATRLQAWRG